MDWSLITGRLVCDLSALVTCAARGWRNEITGSMTSAGNCFGGGDGTVSAAQQGMRNQKEKLSPCAKWLRREIPQMPSGSQWFPIRIIQAGWWCSHGKPCAFCSAISQQPPCYDLKGSWGPIHQHNSINQTSPVKFCIFTWHDWHVSQFGKWALTSARYEQMFMTNVGAAMILLPATLKRFQKSFLLATCLATLFALQLQDSMNHMIGLILRPTLKPLKPFM